MSLRLGFDVDGVLADFRSAFRATARECLGHALTEDGDGATATPLAQGDVAKVWTHIARTPNWWMKVPPHEQPEIARLYALARAARWEVFFLTKRPASAGDPVQFQTQWWLELQGFYLPAVLTVPGSRGDAANALKLDITVDDRLTNCVDIIAASRSKAVLVLRREDQIVRDQALARGIGVVSTLAAAIDAVEQFEEAKRVSSGRLSRLADWFKPSRHDEERLPMDARATLGRVHPPPKA